MTRWRCLLLPIALLVQGAPVAAATPAPNIRITPIPTIQIPSVPVTAATSAPSIRITYITATVAAGGLPPFIVDATVTPYMDAHKSSCRLMLFAPKSPPHLQSPSNVSPSTGLLQWEYWVPASAAAGSWRARVSCQGFLASVDAFVGPYGHASAGFVVVHAHAHVEVVRSGFTQEKNGSGSSIYYGVELKDKSLSRDALGVVVTATFVDKYGRSVATDQNTLTAIAAGRVFYYAGAVFPNVSLTVVAIHLAWTPT